MSEDTFSESDSQAQMEGLRCMKRVVLPHEILNLLCGVFVIERHDLIFVTFPLFIHGDVWGERIVDNLKDRKEDRRLSKAQGLEYIAVLAFV